MKLRIPFDDLVLAFEESDVVRHHIIDTKENDIIYIDETIEMGASEKLEKLEGKRYISLPPRIPQDDFELMESFVYGVEDFDLAERFHAVLEGRKPFRNFKDLLKRYPTLEKRWFAYRDNEMRNQTINWLCENNIELEGQKVMPDIKIEELEARMEDLFEDAEGFRPVICMNCKNKEGLKPRLFSVNIGPENMLADKETKKAMKQHYSIENYGHYMDDKRVVLTTSKCPKCGSDEIAWDY